jgi:hypothetical protein
MAAQVRRIAITATLALLIAFSIPSFVHRREFDVAVSRWTQNQGHENAAALAAERSNNHRLAVRDEMGVGFVVFLVLNAGWSLTSHFRRRVPH